MCCSKQNRGKVACMHLCLVRHHMSCNIHYSSVTIGKPAKSTRSICLALMQVKNKYLKEQRINPKRVHEAMTTRDVGMLKQLSEMAQSGDCTQVGRPALLTAGPASLADDGDGGVPEVPDEDELEALGLCGEEANPGRRAFFY